MNERTRRIAVNVLIRLLLAFPPAYFAQRLGDGGADPLLLLGLLLTATFMGSMTSNLRSK